MSDRPGLARALSLAVLLATVAVTPIAAQPTLLKVSDNKRFLVTADGRPFFWLGDTAWELFHRLDARGRGPVPRQVGAALRFTVIQAVALAEFDGLERAQCLRTSTVVNNDPTTPDVKDGADNDYWDHVDFVVGEAGALGLYVALLPTWGDKWNRRRASAPRSSRAQNAEAYGALARPAGTGRRQHHLDPGR